MFYSASSSASSVISITFCFCALTSANARVIVGLPRVSFLMVNFCALSFANLRLFSDPNRLSLTFNNCSIDLSMDEISLKVGFSSASYYTKIFKQQMGITPLKFKKSQCEQVFEL